MKAKNKPLTSRKGNVSLITIADSNRFVSQKFLELYETIQSHYHKKQLIAVTAANEESGVSTIVGNLAIESALNKKRTLIIDFNLEYPAMAKTFDLLNYTGVTNFLADSDISLPTVIQPSYLLDNLDVMTTGGIQDVHLERITTLVEEVTHYYDCIIFDLPTTIDQAYIEEILNIVDITLVVVRKNKTSAFRLKRFLQQLKATTNTVALVDNEFSLPQR